LALLAFLRSVEGAGNSAVQLLECPTNKIIDIQVLNLPFFTADRYYKVQAQVWFP